MGERTQEAIPGRIIGEFLEGILEEILKEYLEESRKEYLQAAGWISIGISS